MTRPNRSTPEPTKRTIHVTLNIYVPLDATIQRLQLEDCSNIRATDGWHIPCPTGCKAHFDAWADPRLHEEKTGGAYTPLPNSVLAWVSLLPGTTQLGNWTPLMEDHDDMAVGLYTNHSIFCRDDQAVPVWVVTCVGATAGAHLCALFDDEADARNFHKSEVSHLLERLADDLASHRVRTRLE
jgi:hypothetical protein